MTELINVAAEGKSPFFIDPAGVTSITVLPDTKELSMSNENGQLLKIDYGRYGVDAGQLVEKLAEAGNKLVFFPAREGRGEKESVHYVAPSAVSFATVTQVTDGTQGAIVGVKGMGWLASYGTKPEEFENLLDAVRSTGKNLLKFTHDVAYARWSNPSALYIDPAAVNTIRDDGRQVNVYFDGLGPLDVEIKMYSQSEAGRLTEAEEAAKRSLVAEAIAAANSALKKIEGTKFATYLRPENYAYVTFHDDERPDTSANDKYSMTFHRQNTHDNPMPDRVRAYFNSAAARTASFNAIFSQDGQNFNEKKPVAPSPRTL